MTTTEKIKTYYDNIASRYQADRFDNSYGQFIHAQEMVLLKNLLPHDPSKTLSLGCGSGRFMEFADYGIDISPNMIEEARQLFPDKTFLTEDAADTSIKDNYFNTVFSMHVLMHLPKTKTKEILSEIHRILKPGGQFIFDVPSKKRRQLVNYQAQNWHAATAYSIDEIKVFCGNQWKLNLYHGILFLPIHRIPSGLRNIFLKIDNILCQSFLRPYASYMLVVLTKK